MTAYPGQVTWIHGNSNLVLFDAAQLFARSTYTGLKRQGRKNPNKPWAPSAMARWTKQS